MDELFETCNLSIMNQKEIESLSRLIINQETESVIKNLPVT
jgi:hypothetical protein